MKMRPRIRFATALTLVAIAAATTTTALPSIANAAEPTAAEQESAKKLVADGDRLAGQRDFTGALAAYKSAAAITNTPPIALQVARTQEALGYFMEAREGYDKAARMPVAATDPPSYEAARTEAEGLSARIVDRIPTVVVSVSGRPSGSLPTVTVDNVEVASASSALPRRLNPGKHTIRVALAGYQPATVEFEIREGENRNVDVPLVVDPNAAKAGAEPAAAGIVTSPGGPSGSTGASDNYDRSMTFFHVGLVVGGTGLVVGSVFGVLSLARASSAKEHCSDDHCTPDAQSDIDTSTTLANVSNIGFGVAVVGAGLAIYGLVTRPARARAALVVTPVIGPGSAGLTGRF